MKRNNGLKLGCGCLSIIFGFIVIILFAASIYLLNFALKPANNKGRDYNKQMAVMKERYPWIDTWIDSLQSVKALRDTFVVMPGGEKRFFGDNSTRLHAILVNAPQQTAKTAVIIPGYTDCAVNMLHAGYIYNKLMGMNILIPDLHANGKSEGETIQMGWKDRLDVLRWIAIADSLYKDSTGHAQIVVHGQSMGAATTMCVAGEIFDASLKNKEERNASLKNKEEGIEKKLGEDVKCFVEDCGYTSVWDEFSNEINDMFGLPDLPLMYTASALCKAKYGWSFGEGSPLKQVAKCNKPMLFIHGGNDTFVPTRMVYSLYNAKPAPKQMVVFHGSKHAASYHDHPKEYEALIKGFVGKYMK